jgi:hypothetical protein
VNPSRRITIAQLLAHPWMSGAAPRQDMGTEYRKKVKRLAMRHAMKRVLDLPIMGAPLGPTNDATTTAVTTTAATTTSDDGDGNCEESSPAQGRNIHTQDSIDSLDEMELGLGTRDLEGPGARYFALFDRGAKGFLTRDDLRYGVTALMLKATAAADGDNAAAAAIDNAAIEAAVATKTCPGVRVDIDDMFDTMDTDANGEIDIDEFLCFYDIVILPSTIR